MECVGEFQGLLTRTVTDVFQYVRNLAFDDGSETAKLEQDIWPVSAAQMNGFRIGGDAEL